MLIREYLSMLRKRWLYVVLPTLVGLAGTAFLSFSATPIYQATSSVYFSLPFAGSAGDLFQGSNYTQSQLDSYALLATKPVVIEPVIDKLQLDESVGDVAGVLSVSASASTVIIDVRASNPVPSRAANLANAVAEQLGTTVRSLSPRNAADKPSVDATIVAKASPPQHPVSPKKKRDIGAGFVGGLLIGLLLAAARERLDTRVRVPDHLAPLPVLSSMARDKRARKAPLIVDSHDRSRRAEAFRRLRTNLQFVHVDEPIHTIIVTSALASEGKSTTAANLAVVFAEADRRVLLIEADLRRPRISDYLGLERAVGLTNVLVGQADASDVVQEWGRGGLMVLPCGAIPPNPSELLGSKQMHKLLDRFRSEFDVVIIDSPPLLPVTDGAVLSTMADGVVLVVRAGQTKHTQLAAAVEALEAVDARILGGVLNMVAPKDTSEVLPYDKYGYYEPDRPPPTRAGLPEGSGERGLRNGGARTRSGRVRAAADATDGAERTRR